MDLSRNELVGTIPSGIDNLEDLTEWNLGHSGLTGEIPGDIGLLDSLALLDISNNDLNGELPVRLERLYLDENEFTGRIPRGIGMLAN